MFRKIIPTALAALLITGALCPAAAAENPDEGELLKAVRKFDAENAIPTDDLTFLKAVDVDGGYTVAAFYENVSEKYRNTTYVFLFKKAGSSYRALDLVDKFQTHRPNHEPLNFLENVSEPERRFFAYGYGDDLAGGRSIFFDHYILYRVNEDKAERLFVGYTDVFDSYYAILFDLRHVWGWRMSSSYERSYEYRFLDIGEEMPLLLQSGYLEGPEDEAEGLEAVRLFRYKAAHFATEQEERLSFGGYFLEGAGSYAEVPKTLYSAELAGMDDAEVKFLLADRTRRFEHDVPKAIGLYEEAAADTADERVKRGAAAKIEELSFYKDDPKEALAMFDEIPHWGDDRYDELFALYPDSRVAALGRFNMGGWEDYYGFIRDYPGTGPWPNAVANLCWLAATEGAGDLSPREIEPYVLTALEESPSDDYRVLTAVQFGLWAEAEDEYELALKYYHKGYDACRDDYFRDCCTATMATLYDKMGYHKKAFITAVGIENYTYYADYSETGGLAGIVDEYEVEDGGETFTIGDLVDKGALHFATAQLDGEGDDEILAWKSDWDPKPFPWLKILSFKGDKLRVAYTAPGGFHELHIGPGLDLTPCVFTETTAASGGEADTYVTMYGYYDGAYRELGRFDLGPCPRISTPTEHHVIELEVPVYDKGRVVNVGEYSPYSSEDRRYFDADDIYIFDEERAYFVKKEEDR